MHMTDKPKAPQAMQHKDPSADPARRSVLRAAAAIAGVAALNLAALRGATAQKKLKTQEQVKYQPTPKGKQRCDNCDLFVKPDKCKSVEGTVAPEGWCNIWVAF